MPWWTFRNKGHDWMSDSPTFDVEQRANAAYFANQWAEAEHLYREVQSTSEQQGRQVARNMLGSICERQEREHEAIVLYEAKVQEHSPLGHPYHRLAIIFKRLGQPANEERVLRTALHALQGSGRSWYEDRLSKPRKRHTGRER